LPQVPKEAVKAVILTCNYIISLTTGGNLFVWDRFTFTLLTSLRNAHSDPHAEMEACGNIIILNSDYRRGVACKVWKLTTTRPLTLHLIGTFRRPRSLPSRVVLDPYRIGIASEVGDKFPLNVMDREDEEETLEAVIEADSQASTYFYFLSHDLKPMEMLNTKTKAVHFNPDKCFALQSPLFAMAGNDVNSEQVDNEEIFLRSNNTKIWNITTGDLLREIVTDKVPLNGNHDCQQFSMCIQLFLKNNFLYMNKIGMKIANKSPCLSQELQWCFVGEKCRGGPQEPMRTLTLESNSEGAGGRKGRVAIDRSSIVHVGDMGDIVTIYEFWV